MRGKNILCYRNISIPSARLTRMTMLQVIELKKNANLKFTLCIILSHTKTYLNRSRLLSRATKIILYKTLIRPVVSYGVEAWMLTKKEEQAMLIFERKIFRIIYGPKYENGEWESRTNRELEEMSKGKNIVK